MEEAMMPQIPEIPGGIHLLTRVSRPSARIALGAAAGLAVATVAVPVAVGMVGFTAGGIAAGSMAAKMMSAAAIANGGGVPAGSAVATLQSVGAVGLSSGMQAAMAAGGALLGAIPKGAVFRRAVGTVWRAIPK